MKKVTSKDLALKKETITSLSEATSEPAIITYNEDGCRKTFQSVCLCISENVHCKTENPQCGTNTCNASETQGPLCCGPIEETVNDACLFPMTNGTTCVQTMDKIAKSIESSIKYWKRFKNREFPILEKDYEFNLNYSTCMTAMNLDTKAIFAYTNTGRTAMNLAGFMPKCPIYAITPNEEVSKQLALVCDVNPILVENKNSIDEMIEDGVEKAKELGILEKGELIAIAGGASILAGQRSDMNKTIGGILKVE